MIFFIKTIVHFLNREFYILYLSLNIFIIYFKELSKILIKKYKKKRRVFFNQNKKYNILMV